MPFSTQGHALQSLFSPICSSVSLTLTLSLVQPFQVSLLIEIDDVLFLLHIV